ncbi:MAG TPA: hypothetical protein VLL27_00785 [Solirubrobacterales bacterium]|nr:hypothetical protein [Solirubrobacterales bacterium]
MDLIERESEPPGGDESRWRLSTPYRGVNIANEGRGRSRSGDPQHSFTAISPPAVAWALSFTRLKEKVAQANRGG